MQIRPDNLLLKASLMALKLRLKDQVAAVLEAENARLRELFAGQQHAPADENIAAAPAGHGHQH